MLPVFSISLSYEERVTSGVQLFRWSVRISGFANNKDTIGEPNYFGR